MRLFHATDQQSLEGILETQKLLPRIILDLSQHTDSLDQAERLVRDYWSNKSLPEPEKKYIRTLTRKDPRSQALWMGDFSCANDFASSDGIILGFDVPEEYQQQVREQFMGGRYAIQGTLGIEYLREFEPVDASNQVKKRYEQLLQPLL